MTTTTKKARAQVTAVASIVELPDGWWLGNADLDLFANYHFLLEFRDIVHQRQRPDVDL